MHFLSYWVTQPGGIGSVLGTDRSLLLNLSNILSCRNDPLRLALGDDAILTGFVVPWH